MIKRKISIEVRQSLEHFPAVAILGPRQSGKSTLAKSIMAEYENSLYLDLENPSDVAKLANPLLFFNANSECLICLDEIQRMPEIFPLLRSVIDESSRNSQFLLLGSASPDLLKQSSESLAGKISYKELTPFLFDEIRNAYQLKRYWVRGGFPRSFLAANDEISFEWLDSFIKTFLERDIPQLGFNMPANNIRRLWIMCAHLNGEVLNASKISESLGVSSVTVKKYLDILSDTYMIRLLKPFESNTKKRIVKSPKIYIRDIGITNALLQITGFNQLLAHPKFGASWESIVIENIVAAFKNFECSFFRTQDRAEIDLVLHNQNFTFAIECKTAMAPKPSRGFWNSIQTIQPDKSYIAAPVNEHYKIAENVEVGNFDFIIDDIKSIVNNSNAAINLQHEQYLDHISKL